MAYRFVGEDCYSLFNVQRPFESDQGCTNKDYQAPLENQLGESISGLQIFINLDVIIKYRWYIDYGMLTFNNYQYSNEKNTIPAAF